MTFDSPLTDQIPPIDPPLPIPPPEPPFPEPTPIDPPVPPFPQPEPTPLGPEPIEVDELKGIGGSTRYIYRRSAYSPSSRTRRLAHTVL